MKIISCIGFHDTGSGVVDAILKEFDNCASAKLDLECRFLQDPDGISDLQYNLIDNPHRLNSGYALKRYQKFVKKWNWFYSKLFGSNWKYLSEQYINELITERYDGYWHCEIFLHNSLIRIIYFIRKAINKLLPSTCRKTSDYNYFPNDEMWHVHVSKDKFLESTRNYCSKLCECINTEGKEFLVLDQLLPPSNIERYIRYFDDIKVVIVDRDPRDVYIHQVIAGAHVLPKDPIQFCNVYRDNRELIDSNPSKEVLILKFEDFIYNYNSTYKILIDFIGENETHHIHRGDIFSVEKSRENTKLWIKYPEYSEIASLIAKELPEYLYW